MSEAPSPPEPTRVADWLSRRAPTEGVAWQAGPPMGDVSSRKYYRAKGRDDRSLIVAWYPDEATAAYDRYLEASRLLGDAAVRVPRIVATDPERRFMALEDVGDRRLFDLEPSTATVALFEQALRIVRRIEALPRSRVEALGSPPLDLDVLQRELDQTWALVLSRLLASPARERVRASLDDLCGAIAEQPTAPCHRDFMARNLMVLGGADGPELVVIDHQDLRLGPLGYDVSSLLHDSCRLAPAQIERLEASEPRARGTAYQRLVVQRTLKIVGTFHAFAARGAPTYLPMVPGTLSTMLEHLARLPGSEGLAVELREELREVLGDPEAPTVG